MPLKPVVVVLVFLQGEKRVLFSTVMIWYSNISVEKKNKPQEIYDLMQEVSKFKSHNKQNKKATEHLSSSRTFKEKVTLDLLAKVMRTSVSLSGEESMVYWGPAGSDFLLPADASRT